MSVKREWAMWATSGVAKREHLGSHDLATTHLERHGGIMVGGRELYELY